MTTSPSDKPTGFLASVFSLPTFFKLRTNTTSTPDETTDEQPCKELYKTLVHCLNTREYQRQLFECVGTCGKLD